jgi:hypothetical protein
LATSSLVIDKEVFGSMALTGSIGGKASDWL